jgi:hypothetical protein
MGCAVETSHVGTDVTAVCDGYFNALVAQFDSCATGDSRALVNGRTSFATFCTNRLTAPGASNVAAKLATCTQTLADSCEVDSTCFEVAGSLDDGAPCGEDFQCKSGSCKKADDATCGACAAATAVGEPCDEGRACTTGSSCKSNRCVARSGSAPRGAIGDACITGQRAGCATGLACIEGKCGARLPEGAGCTFMECESGLGCDPNERRCAKQVLVKTDEACDSVRLCETGLCHDKKCVQPLAAGAACAVGGLPCELYVQCRGGKCVPDDPTQCK